MVNPIRHILADEAFDTLFQLNLINEKRLRDFEMRLKYDDYRRELSAFESLEKLKSNYPYLQADTIRKIVYSIRSVI